MNRASPKFDPIPAKAGIGLRAPHYREILATLPAAGWFEVHGENFFGDGGQPLYFLERIRSHYPLALHGVGLSLGSAGPLDRARLARIKSLAGRFQPGFVSEHLSWAGVDGRYSNCLLPLPYTEKSLKHVCRRVERVQEFLGRRILIENVSSYLQFKQSTVPEWACHKVFFAADRDAFPLDRLAQVPQSRHGHLRFKLNPACRLVRSRFPIHRIWEIHQADYAGESAVDPHEGGADLLIGRRERVIGLFPLSSSEWDFLNALGAEQTFSKACVGVLAKYPGFDVAGRLRRFVAEALLVDFYDERKRRE
ncbi:MAG: DUF692 domain-containing protein, partial [Nitrospinae bacterium]|nr:DUF692 domain-containing protein [Nitrospinota bacterium]